jgi:hypothetical protein
MRETLQVKQVGQALACLRQAAKSKILLHSPK